MQATLMVLGASVRAAAFSARRAGYLPIAADLFADADLAQCCSAVQVKNYPAELEAAARDAPPGPWFYTGGLENHPDLVDRIAAARLLYGNPGEVLSRVRNPYQVAAALEGDGLRSPAVCKDALPNVGGPWLRKPLHSCGGSRIHFAGQADAAGRSAANDLIELAVGGEGSWYLQQFIKGMSCSAVYVAAGGGATLLGVTEQLVGCSWAGASDFRYCGSLGPLPLDARSLASFQQIGNCLARAFSLAGLFGVDAIWTDEGIWPVEVNPRYTASIEILERALGIAAVALHVAACRDNLLPTTPAATIRCYCAKAILYAHANVTLGNAISKLAGRLNSSPTWPVIADVPRTGTMVASGQPLTTVLASGPARLAILQQLQQLAELVRQTLTSNSLPQEDVPAPHARKEE